MTWAVLCREASLVWQGTDILSAEAIPLDLVES